MTTLPLRFWAPLAFAIVGATPAMADGNLLWKAFNPAPAAVVPAYVGQLGPFPMAVVAQEVSDTAAMDEQTRLRDEAVAQTSRLIQAGRALQPELASLQVGGVVDGRLGPRVLLNNQWVGVGVPVKVRQRKTAEITEAFKTLSEVDPASASTMMAELDSALAAQPVMNLKVTRISPTHLVLSGPDGKAYTVNINIK